MVQQGIALAKQGEGIRIAFERLGRGDILDGLREATHGTVTDLELMKAAVKFNDFRLPVEELGTMLAFAQQKAKDTGQSVDYMVDSIVTGLGRKSLMILDNLGLSAAEIKDKMAETGDMTKAVGAIIREQMAKAGDYVETAADRAAQANVSLQNKMEELGRKFAPLQEASNSLWTSMKIGILDVVGGPLARLLNGLTEVGRMMNAYNKMGGSDKVGRMTAELAGASEQDRQSIYQQRQEELWRYINPREQQIKDIRAWQSGQRGEALQGRISAIREEYGMLDTAKIQAEVDAAKKMLSDYQQAAKQILSPVKPVIETSGAEQSIDSLKGKLAELEAQRKKAIAAGDTDLSKNLAKQITQTKADIKGLGGSVSTSTTTKEVTIQQKISELEKEAVKASEQRREEIRATIQELDRELAKQKEIVAALHEVPADAVGKAYSDMLRGGRVQLPDEAPLSTAHVGIMPGYLTQPVTDAPTALQAAQYEAAKSVKAEDVKVDTSTLQSILRNALQEGIDTATLNLDGVAEQIGRGINVPDETWQGILDEYNALREAIGQDPIEIDFKTGKLKELKENSKGLAGDWQNASSAIQAVGSALGSIEDPAAKVAGIVAQAIATVSLTFASSLKGTVTPWDWIAAAAAGTATMVSTIAAIKSSTKGGFAEGGIVPGNSFSGDNLRISDYGINSGELILSRSQQDSIAAQLTGDDGQASGGGSIRDGRDAIPGCEQHPAATGQGRDSNHKHAASSRNQTIAHGHQAIQYHLP